MDSQPETAWIADRLSAIAPAWNPDVARARRLVEDAPVRSRRPAWRYALATTMAALIVAAIAPSGRALAQDLWRRWFVTRVAVVRLDLSRLPLQSSIAMGPIVDDVASPADAAAKAGFAPYLPPVDLLGPVSTLQVVGRLDVTQVVRTAAIEEALRREGVTDLTVPPEWNGVTLRAVVGPAIAASYAGDVELVQAPPIRLELPAAFPLARFTTTMFRAAGMAPDEARALGEEYAARPAWLLDVPAHEAAAVEIVPLPRGTGLLVDDVDRDGPVRASVIVSRADRIYVVSSPSRDQSLRLAAALP